MAVAVELFQGKARLGKDPGGCGPKATLHTLATQPIPLNRTITPPPCYEVP